MPESHAERSALVGKSTWLASFAIATIIGLGMAAQRWFAYRGPNKPASFWDAPFIQPQLIPWFVWAAIAPLLILLFDRLPWGRLHAWRRAMLGATVAVLVVTVQATVTGLALGWWWSFPSLVPMDPVWHIADQLRTRSTLSLLVVWLIAATYYARVRARARVSVSAPAPAPPDPIPTAATQVVPKSPLALRTPDRVWFVEPRDIDWIEADGDYVVVHVGAVHHRIRETISSIERRVPPELLVRVSRSAIVNLSSVQEMQRWFRGNFVIILRDGTRVTTGARYRDRIFRRT